ncbi:hypothetical protein BO71DRAFT_404296 [Aspergillus ellipticus CBS 707.79]|uniref:Nitroreductase domain-containing protein n=1 Tax=Aspergillus ellipticus CBS 707.79 TaxID=1448320 RepID=A0A319CT32_9EURO|nr:hypothetical protein BO71DRAFT_404296 [Aspergillus ellipticus CBS 707.79]
MNAAKSHPSPIHTIPEPFTHYRSTLGKKVYAKALDILTTDLAARQAAQLRNVEFLGVPLARIICIDRAMYKVDLLSVGMWLQTLVLELTAQGLDTCFQVSIAGFAEVVKRELGMGDRVEVLCGLAVGDWGPEARVNRVVVVGRDGWEGCMEVRD